MTDTEYAQPDKLVDVTWVLDHIGDENVRVVEVDVDLGAYAKGHLPGAIAWNWTTDLNDPVRRDIVTPEAFADLLERSGITPGTRVVLYGDNHNWFAAFAAWLLAYHGHEDYALVDGGRRAVETARVDLTTEVPRYARAEYPVPGVRAELRATRDEVLTRVREGPRAFVDVRSPDEFTGKVLAPPGLNETAQRGGHIPGATNVPWSKAVTDSGTFRGVDELRELYAPVLTGEDVVTYCRIGERSAHSWFVLRHLLGVDAVKNYDGSWTEYGNLVGVPVETGA